MFAGKNIDFIVDNDADGQKLVAINTNGETLNSWLFSDANHVTPSGSITTSYMPLMKLVTDDEEIQSGKLPVADKIAYERDIHYTTPNNYSFDNGDSIYIVMQKAIFNKYYQRIQVNNANRKIKKYADEGMWIFDKDSSIGATEKDGNVSFDESLVPTFEGYTNIVTINNQGTSLTPTGAKEVPSAKIDLDASELSSTVDVTYKPNKQQTYIKFVDDTLQGIEVKTGKSNTMYGSTDEIREVDPDNLLIPKGYELAKGQTNPISYTFKAKDNQPIIIHLVHKIMEITPDTPPEDIPADLDVDLDDLIKKANLTVNYVNNNGKEFTAKIPENHTQTLTFKGKAYYDLVTRKLVNAKYVQDAKITVRYLDGNNNFKVLDQKVVEGEIGDQIDYDVNAKIQEYEEMGYVLDSNGYTAGDTFTEDNNGKTYDIIFRHASTPVTPDNPNFPSSLFTNLMAVPSSTSETEIPGHWVLDTDNHDKPKIHWDYDKQSFATVISPDEAHYYVKEITSDDNKDHRNGNDVNVININRNEITSLDNTKSINLTVTYAPKRTINVKFIDDTTKQELSSYNKDFNEAKPGDSLNDYSTSDAIKTLEDKNYVLVSDGFTDAKLNNQMPDADETYEVHLVHGATPKTETKKVNLNVTYKAEDGSDFNADARKEAHQTVDFTGTYFVDAVTGKEDKVNAKQLNGKWVVDSNNKSVPTTKWNDETKSFEKVVSPQKDHYYVTDITSDDQINHRIGDDVDEIDGLTHDSNDINVVVKYALKHNINVHYIDDNPTDQQDLSGYDWKLEAKPGDALNYTTDATLKTLEAKGYKLEDVAGKGDQFTVAKLDGKMPNVDGVYNVYLIHATTTVTPEKPGTPGQPVDPGNPDGPKYPDGTDKNSVKRTGTQTVHYVGAGDRTPKDDNQSFDFTRTITFDNVTGKIIETTPWSAESHTFGVVKTPVVTGYYADNASAGGTTITPDDLNKTVIVTYKPVGHIIPVDPNGKLIPDVPTPQFPNDPDDPTKITPGAKPAVPGYHPESGKPGDPVPTPENPGEDVKVPYAKDQGSVQVVFHDDTKNKLIPDVGYNSGKEDANTSINYTITQDRTSLEKQGYVYVSTDGTIPAEIEGNKDVIVTVHMKHGTKPVTPDNPTNKYTKSDLQKQATRTINYYAIDDNSKNLVNSESSTVIFTGSGVEDAVTHNLVNLNPDGSIKDQNGQLTWTYSVYDGLMEDNTLNKVDKGSSYTFAKTSERLLLDYNGSTYNFNSVDPEDYNDGNGAVKEYKVNAQNNPVDLTVNVLYKKQPTYHAGKIDTREVTRTINYLDAQDYSRVVAPQVTQTSKLSRIEILNDNNQFVGYGTVSVDGKSYTIDNSWKVDKNWAEVISPDLSFKGYKAPSEASVAAQTVNQNTQDTIVNVYYDHNEIPVGPNTPDKHGVAPSQYTKDVKETVHYIVSDGKVTAPADKVQTSKWTRIVTVDEVTTKVVSKGQYDTDWAIEPGQKTSYDQVDTPVLNGYYADKADVASTPVTQDDIETTVTYEPVGHIIPTDPEGNPIPSQDHPQFPNDPSDPTKVTPGTKPTVPGYHPESGKPGEPVAPTPGNPDKDIDITYVKDQGAVQVIFHDDTTNTTIPNVGYNSGNEEAGTKVDYTTAQNISDLENQGYIYVGTDGEVPAEIPANSAVTVIVHMKHGTKPVNPNNPDNNIDPSQYTKDVKETVHYIISDGKVTAPADNVQTSKWTRTLTIDTVTHKLVSNGQYDIDWIIPTGEKKNYDAIVSPNVPGYHPDQNSIATTPVTQGDIYKTVVYSPNGTTIQNQQTIHTSATVHYEGAGEKTPTDNVQSNFDFVYSGDTYDTHTNQNLFDGTWNTTEHAYNAVDVPNVDGYHSEITVVPASDLTVTRDNPEVTVTVKYVKNGEEVVNKQSLPASQTVQYVGEDGNALLTEKKQTAEFTYSGDTRDSVTGQITKQGSWNETNHNFTAEDVPVIDGYVAVAGYTNEGGKYVAGGFNASNTGGDADRNKAFTVVYKKVGKIIPVDPEQKPIPDAPTPTYTNDPQDPTKVTPNEKTPDVPGYIPSVPTVTPKNPGTDTPVHYTPVTPVINDQNAVVNYIDQDNNNAQIATSGNLTGKAGSAINYSTADEIKQLENQGYELVSDGFPTGATFDDDNTTQTYTVVLKHGHQPVNPQNPGKPGEPINPNDPNGPKFPQDSDKVTKSVTRTIQYVNESGNKVSEPVEQTANFTGEGVLDKVTGQWITPITWTGNGNLDGRKTPVIDGYHVGRVSRDSNDNVNVDGTTVNHETNDYTVTVSYIKNGKLVPGDKNNKPQYPINPTEVTSNEPGHYTPDYTPEVPTITPTPRTPSEVHIPETPIIPENPSEPGILTINSKVPDTVSVTSQRGQQGNLSLNKKSNNLSQKDNYELPQTGNEQSNLMLGFTFTMFASIFGLTGLKKKKRDK